MQFPAPSGSNENSEAPAEGRGVWGYAPVEKEPALGLARSQKRIAAVAAILWSNRHLG